MGIRVLIGFVVLVCAVPFLAQERPAGQDADFRNFTFLFPQDKFLGVPGKMAWMSLDMKSTVKLVNGRYDFDKSNPASGPSITA